MSAPHTAVSDDNVVVVSTEAPKSVAWHDHHGMELTHVREFEPRCVFRASPSTHDRTPWGDPPINPLSRFPTRDRPFCQKRTKTQTTRFTKTRRPALRLTLPSSSRLQRAD